MNSYETKLNHCIDILNTFPKDCKSLTVHVEDYFKNVKVSEEEKAFVVDVFAETIKYYKILAVVINQFYETDGRNNFHADKNLYFVLLFIIIFRLDDIGLEMLKNYLNTQKIKNMYQFLNFFTDEKNLFTWIELEWRKLYDPIFVENELMDNLKKWLPQLRAHVHEMRNVLDNKPTKRLKAIPITKPEPFDLTKPKPKRVPMPELIPQLEKAKEVPATTYTVADQVNRHPKKDPKVLMKEADRLRPSCAQREISKKTVDKMNQIVIERDRELKFNDYKSKPIPKSIINTPVQTKLNTATILREWKLYETRIEKKNKELKKLEEGSFNSLQFEAWQQSLRTADLAENIAQLEKLRLGGKISYEEAILKRDRLIQENQEIVKTLKKENAERMEIFAKEKLLNDERMRALVEQINTDQEGVKEARLLVQKQKNAMAKEIAEESRRLQEAALIEIEIEMRRKMDIIAEIRALEGSQGNYQKFVDPTEISGYGLLCEMSLTELKERLILSKQKCEEEILQKRDVILENKQQKEKQLNDTLDLLKICRSKYQDKCIQESTHYNPSPDNLNEDQLKELQDLRDKLDEKRLARQSKNGRDQVSSSSRGTNSSRVVSIRKQSDSQDRCELRSRSTTVERMAQILSI